MRSTSGFNRARTIISRRENRTQQRAVCISQNNDRYGDRDRQLMVTNRRQLIR